MMKNLLILSYTILSFNILFAQNKNGHQWILENFSHLDFTSGQLVVKSLNPTPSFGVGSQNTTLSDNDGNILLSTGGCFILNKQFKLLEGGDSINSFFTYRGWCKGYGDGDFPLQQNNTILPFPDSPNLKIVFNLDFDYAPDRGVPVPYNLYYHIVDMNQNNGLGKVKEWKRIAVADTFTRGFVQAVKHGNGKNWWVIVPKWTTNCLFITEITPQGVSSSLKQCLGKSWKNHDDSGGQINASPDGKLLARVSNKNYAVIYRFNNLDGSLTNPIELTFPVADTTGYLRGISFSSNSRYLYIASKYHLYQFDLMANNIQNSMQLVGDLTTINFNGGKHLLYFSKLAPDGKIYIASPFSHKFLSVINRPNCPGVLCDFKAHAIELPEYNYNGLPNNPFFEIPPANYNCDSINTTTQEIIENAAIYPNPATTQITISSSNIFQQFDITALTGQTMLKGKLSENTTDVDVSTLPEGIYFIKLTNTLMQTRALGKFVLKR